MEKKLKFSEEASSYASNRPNYPIELIHKIIQDLGNASQLTLVDVGAGTGIASRQFAEQGVKVFAIELVPEMIEAAEPHQLVEFRQAPAESIPLSDSTANVVTIFQAFHWFKFEQSLREFQRILKPSGRIAIIWYGWDKSDPFTNRYQQFIHEAKNQPSSSLSYYKQLRKYLRWLKLPINWYKGLNLKLLRQFCWMPHFKNVRRYEFAHQRAVDLSSLIGEALSQSFLPHEGPIWENLLSQIKDLANHTDDQLYLKYKMTLYVGTSKKI
jgi:ubiquinone/menaquinone biosynthesis C-methylase UbiE